MSQTYLFLIRTYPASGAGVEIKELKEEAKKVLQRAERLKKVVEDSRSEGSSTLKGGVKTEVINSNPTSILNEGK
jgi:hypothetical protein